MFHLCFVQFTTFVAGIYGMLLPTSKIYSNYENIWCACYNLRANLTTFHQPTYSNNPRIIPKTSSLPKLGGTVSPVPVWPKATAMSRQPPTTKTPSNASYCATQTITQFHLSLPTQNLGVILLMDKILHQLIRSLSHHLQGFLGFLPLTFLKLHFWDETSKTKPKKNTFFFSDPFSPWTKVLKSRLLCQCSCLALPIPARWRGKCQFFLGGNWNRQTIDAGKII